MKKEKNCERLWLFVIAAAILAVSSIAIIGAEPGGESAHRPTISISTASLRCIPNLSCNS